jgi:hypothetical protein
MQHLTRRLAIQALTGSVVASSAPAAISGCVDGSDKVFRDLAEGIWSWCAICGTGDPVVVCAYSPIGVRLYFSGHTIFRTTPWAFEDALGMVGKHCPGEQVDLVTTEAEVFEESWCKYGGARIRSATLVRAPFDTILRKGSFAGMIYPLGFSREVPELVVASRQAIEMNETTMSMPSLITLDV